MRSSIFLKKIEKENTVNDINIYFITLQIYISRNISYPKDSQFFINPLCVVAGVLRQRLAFPIGPT
jgi:hypothetical protein